MSVRLLLPCVRFKVEVQAYADNEPTPLEKAALLYVVAEHSERPTARELSGFLCIGKTATNDLLLQLWHRGWLHIDTGNGRISVRDFVEDGVREGKFAGMGSVNPPDILDFIYDVVGGQIAALPGENALHEAGSPAYTYPRIRREKDAGAEGLFEMPLEGFMDIGPTELIEALTAHPYYKSHLKEADRAALKCRALRPMEKLLPAHVKYYGVYFDVYRDGNDRIALEVNDTRPVQRQLGRNLCAAIVAVLGDAPKLNQTLEKAARGRAPDFQPARRALQAFAHRTGQDLDQAFAEDRIVPAGAAGALWNEARAHLLSLVSRRADLARSRGLPDGKTVRGTLLSALAEEAAQVVIASPRIGYKALTAESGKALGESGTAGVLSLLERRRQVGTVFVQTTDRSENDVIGALEALKTPERFRFCQRDSHGAHTGASVAVFDHLDVLLASEPLVDDANAMGLLIRFDGNGNLPGSSTEALLRRLERDFGSRGELPAMVLVDPQEQQKTLTMPPSLAKLIDSLDAEFPVHVDDEDEDQPKDRPSNAELAVHRLGLKERCQKAAAVLDWASFASDAVEILTDAEIHDNAVGILHEAGVDEPLAIGLSSREDLRDNAQLMDALRNRLLQPKSGPVFLCLPGDPKLAGLVDIIRDDVGAFDRVTVQLARKGARWGFGFVISPRECVLGTDGLGRRVLNVGRGRRGTEIGLTLHGPQLRELAFAALAGSHDMSAVRAAFRALKAPQSPSPPALSALLADWQVAKDPLFDGNLGVSVVRDRLRQDPQMPWRPDDDATASFFNGELRHAVLKSAAAERRDGAAEVLARTHWQRGDLLHAAILADELPDTFLLEPEFRRMCLAVATGRTYAGELPQVLLDSPDHVHRREFMLMSALLMLEGRADQLAAWMAPGVYQAGGFALSDNPLERLVAALAERAGGRAGAAVELGAVAAADAMPEFGEIWNRLAKLLTIWRNAHENSSSVRALRDTLFRHEGSMTGQLANLVLGETKDVVAKARISGLWQLRATHPDLFGHDPEHVAALIDKPRRRRIAADYFDQQHRAARTRFGVNEVDGMKRDAYCGSVVSVFEDLYELHLAAKRAQPDHLQDQRLLHCAMTWLESVAMPGSPAGARGCGQLEQALRLRLTAPFPPFPLLTPPWALPLVDTDGAPDWAQMHQGLLCMEFPIGPGSLRQVMELREDCAALEAAKDKLNLPPAWVIVWQMLERCLSLPPDLRQAAELDSVFRDFRRRLDTIRTDLANGINDLQRMKARHDLISAEFDTLAAELKALLAKFELTSNPDAPLPQSAGMKLLLEAEVGLDELNRRYDRAFSTAKTALLARLGGMAAAGDERTAPIGIRRGHIQKLFDLDRLDVARWYLANAPALALEFRPPPSDSGHQAAFLAALRHARDRDALVNRVTKYFADVAAHGDALLLLKAFGRLVFSGGDAAAAPVDGETLFSALAGFFGVSFDRDRMKIAEDPLCWRLTTSDPKLICLAPYLARVDREEEHLTLVVPKGSSEMGKLLDRESKVHPENWRYRLFRHDGYASTEFTQNGVESEHGLAELDRLLMATDSVAAEAGVPLLISAFAIDPTDRAPVLTHLQLINLLSLSPANRRHAAARRLAQQLTAGNLKSWWSGHPRLAASPLAGAGGYDRHKKTIIEHLLETPWTDLENEARARMGLSHIIGRAADRLDIGLSGAPRAGGERHESDVYTLACLVYFSGGDVLNAFDLVFEALVETRRGRRYLDITPVLSRLRPDRGLGRRLLLRSLPDSLLCGGDWSAARSLLEALILATPGTGGPDDYAAFDPNLVLEVLIGEAVAAPLLENWLQIALDGNMVEGRRGKYKVNSANGNCSPPPCGMNFPVAEGSRM